MLTIGADCDVQAHCPLYSQVPAEIRNRIFAFALSPFDNRDHAYQADKPWCWRGYRHPQTLDTRLLQTCKRIYGECRLLPVAQTEFVYCFYSDPGLDGLGIREHFIPPKSPKTGTGARFHYLTGEQQRSVENMHIFIQQFYLEMRRFDFTRPWLLPLSARKITLTVQLSNWWSWRSPEQSPDRLAICPWLPGSTTWREMEAEPLDPSLDYIKAKMGKARTRTWGQRIAGLQRLEVLEMEFETRLKQNQLDVVTERAKGWKFPREDGTHLCWTGEMSETKGDGVDPPIRTSVDPRDERAAAREPAEPPRRTYVATALTFRPVKS